MCGSACVVCKAVGSGFTPQETRGRRVSTLEVSCRDRGPRKGGGGGAGGAGGGAEGASDAAPAAPMTKFAARRLAREAAEAAKARGEEVP